MTEIKVLTPAFPLSHSANSYFCERKQRVTPRGGGEFMRAKLFVQLSRFFVTLFEQRAADLRQLCIGARDLVERTARVDVRGGLIGDLAPAQSPWIVLPR
jgi:hypothetical protein